MCELPDFEVKVVPRLDLSAEEMSQLLNDIHAIADSMGMQLHADQITYSKRLPYKKFSDIPTGVKFYSKMKKFLPKLAALEYYSYAEGDMNGRLVGRSNQS